tara:strand:- start:79 stop:333 length:255 start_codon:yes stop_codon:yes gene_type:complete
VKEGDLVRLIGEYQDEDNTGMGIVIEVGKEIVSGTTVAMVQWTRGYDSTPYRLDSIVSQNGKILPAQIEVINERDNLIHFNPRC